MTAEPTARPYPLARERQLAMYHGRCRRCRAARTPLPGVGRGHRVRGPRHGRRVWDLDGNEYVDLRMGYGPVILGHGDDRVDD